jgi:polar amino acid transport system substrate-binding protein
MEKPDIHPSVLAELAPNGTLRAGINLSNFLLVKGKASNGDPIGVSADMAAEIARRLAVRVEYFCYPDPGSLADGAELDAWDIGNIGAEPQRAETIAFTAAYCEIPCTYLVPAGSNIRAVEDVDQPGRRIAATGRTAYGLWLENNIRHAEIVQTDTIDSSFDVFVEQGLDALAGLHPRLIQDVTRLPGAHILDGQFSAVQQAIGTPRRNKAAAAWLFNVVEELKASGFVAGLMAKHGVAGLRVAPPA